MGKHNKSITTIKETIPVHDKFVDNLEEHFELINLNGSFRNDNNKANDEIRNSCTTLIYDGTSETLLEVGFQKLSLNPESEVGKESPKGVSQEVKTRGPHGVKSKPPHEDDKPYAQQATSTGTRLWQSKPRENQFDLAKVYTDQIKQSLCSCSPCSFTMVDECVVAQRKIEVIMKDHEAVDCIVDMSTVSNPISTVDHGYSSLTDSSSCSNSPTERALNQEDDVDTTVLPKETKSKKKRNKYLDNIDQKSKRNAEYEIKKHRLNERDQLNRTVLHNAIEKGLETLALVFINKIEFQFRPLDVHKRNPDLKDFDSCVSFLDQKDMLGRTPLLLACICNLPRIASYLLDLGASPTLNDDEGSILNCICKRGHAFLEVAEVICEKAKSCVNMTNGKKQTPLHIAVSYHNLIHENEIKEICEVVDNKSLIELLLQNGANIKMQDEYGQTALHNIIITQNVDLLQCAYMSTLSSQDWNQAINMRDTGGRTVLHRAVCCCGMEQDVQRSLIEKLVKFNASPLIEDHNERRPIDYVLPARHDLIKLLMKTTVFVTS